MLAVGLAATSFALVAPFEGAKAAASGDVESFAGGVGEGLGTEIGQIAHVVSAGAEDILASDISRRLVRSLDRGTGIQTAFAGNGAAGPFATLGAKAAEVSLAASDIERVGSDVYLSSDVNNFVVRVDANGVLTSVLTGISSQGIAVADDGTLYYADPNRNHVHRRLPDGTTQLVAGAANGAEGYADGAGAAALFNGVRDIELSGDTLYVSDTFNFRVRAIDLASGDFTVSTLAGNGTNNIDSTYSGPALGGGFRNVLGLDMLANGDLLVATGDGGFVRVIHVDEATPSNSTMERFAGPGAVRPPTTSPGSSPLTAQFGRTYDVSVAPDGAVAIGGDLGLFVVEGGGVRRVAGNYTRGRAGDGLSATDPITTLFLPRGLAADSAGNVYIADTSNEAIRKVDTNGIITRFAGHPETFVTNPPLGDGGPATAADINAHGVAVDRQGNVYVTDPRLHRVRKIDLNGIITTIAGTGTAGFAGDGGPATAAQLDNPWSIAVGGDGAVYVTEQWQTRIRRIAGGTITTIYDAPGVGDPATGISATRGLAVGPDNAVYFADSVTPRVMRIPPGGGAPDAVAGTGVNRNGNTPLGEGALATVTNVQTPVSVALDHASNIYFNDGCSIRKVDAVTRKLATLAGTGACGVAGIGGPARSASFGTATGIAIVGTDLVFSDQSSHRVFSVADVVPPPAPPEADVLTGKIAWHTDDGYGNDEVVVADPDGSNRVRLTNSPTGDADPDFSNDGSHVAFVSDRTGNHDVWVMRSDGSGLLNLTAGSGLYEADPSWSPTEERVAFVRNNGPYDIITVNADGTNEVNVTSAFDNGPSFPSWTANGQDILFAARTNELDFEIQRISAAGGATPVELTNNSSEEFTPQSSPDGSKIVYTSNAGGDSDIWIMNTDGSNQTRLTTDPASESFPTFSPDGKYILFSTGAGQQLWRIRVDGSNRTLVADGGGRNETPTWVDNFRIFPTMPHIPAQPATVEGADVLLQPKAPAISSAPGKLALLDVLNSPGPLALLDVLNSPGSLALLDVLNSPGKLALLDVLNSPGPLALLDVLNSPGKLALLDVLNSPGLRQALDEISLVSIPIEGGWESYFTDGAPIQSKSLLDALESGQRVPLLSLDISGTPLANISLFSVFLNQTALRDLADGPTEARWCEALEPLDDAFVPNGGDDANDCGAARFAAPQRSGGTLSASLIELQMQGLPLSLFPELAALTVGDVIWGDAVDTWFESGRLPFVDLSQSDLGAVTVGQLAAVGKRDAVVDCNAVAGICAPSETLAFVQQQGALRSDAIVRDLLAAIDEHNVLLTLIGILPTEIRPLQAIDNDSEILAAVDEVAVGDVAYNVDYTPVGLAKAREATVSMSLPSGFIPVRNSATISVDLGAPVSVPMTVDGRRVRIRLEDVSIPAGSSAGIGFFVRPGQLLSNDRRLSGRITAPGLNQAIGNAAGVRVMERFEPENNAPATAPTLAPDTVYLTHIGEPGDVDYFTLPLNAGDRVRLLLDQPSPDVPGDNADLDLVVYAPAAATTAPLRATVDSNEAIVPVFDNPNRLGEPIQPDVVQEINLLPEPVAAISTNRGSFNESVSVLAPVTGNYVVQVSGFGDAASSHAYSLQGTRELGEPTPSCTNTPRVLQAVTAEQRGTLPAGVDSTKDTLVLVNPSRLYGFYDAATVDALLAQVNAFAAHSSVNGAVVGVDGSSAVSGAYAAWDADPCSVELANDVVREINAAVDSLVDLRTGDIDNIVVIGNDDVIPMARIPDLTQAANERAYADAARIAGGSVATASALAGGNILSDDPYGDGAPAPYLGRHLYISDVALGRLVESPQDMASQLSSYLRTFADESPANDGRLDKSTALTAGTDFMQDVATEIDSTLDGLTGAAPTADNQLIGDAWTDADLKPRFTSSANPADLVSLNAHFSHDALVPARIRDELDPAGSRVTTADVDAGTVDGGLMFSMGCHSGLNIPDIVVGAPGTRDWAQALSAKKASLVGQTGFGYGLQDAIALSEDIMLGFTRNLTTTMSVGEALAFAKHDYLGGIGVYGVYDEKALGQATLYGLPMWKVGTGAIAAPPAPRPLSTDGRTGLKTASFDHAETFTPHTSANGTYWSGLGGTQVVHDRPIQPKSELDVTQIGLVAHGAEITGLTSDEVSANAVFARVVLDDADREREIENPTSVFPAAMQRINDVATPHGERQRLVLLSGQYRAGGLDADGNVTGAQRFYRRMAGKVHYSTSSDFTTPDILRTDASELGDAVAFAVGVDDALGAATVKAVSVLYHAVGENDAGTDEWTRIELARDPSDPTQWLGTGGGAVDADGEDLEYLVVALDSAGNSAYATRKGAFFAAAAPPPPPAGVEATIDGQPSGSGWYSSAKVVLSSDDGSTFEYSVDDGEWQAYDEPIPVTGDGNHEVEYRTSGGETGTVVVPIDASAPSISIASPVNGASVDQGAVLVADYTCSDDGSGIASCAGPVADGANVDTSTAGTHTFTVTATDGAGHTSHASVSYTVKQTYRFDGFYTPIKNPEAVNTVTAGNTVPAKWRLFDPAGKAVTDPASVTQIRSFAISCSSKEPAGAAEIHLRTVRYDLLNKQFVYNWTTKKGWAGSCRRFEITFKGGLVRYADFKLVK